MTPTPHDALFKATYSDPARAAAHLATVLPPALVARLDLDALEVLPGSFIDPELAQSASDLLYGVRTHGGGQALVYLLFEHQSSPDPMMPLRLFLYAARVLDRWQAENPDATRIPALLPLVLYHGHQPWRAPLALSGMFGIDADDLAAFDGLGLDLRYQLHDLSAYTDEDLLARAKDAMDLLAQLLLKHGREPDLIEQLTRWEETWRKVAEGPGLRAIQILLSYIGNVQSRRSPERVRRFLVQTLGNRGEEAFMTWNQQIEARGEARGRLEGQRGTLLRLLRQRFGVLSDAVESRVNAASTDDLSAWTDDFFRATTPEQLVGL